MSYEQRISMAIAPRPMDLEEVANEITERGVSDFWGSMFIWFATQNGFGEKTQPIRIQNLGYAILVIIGFPPHTPAKRQGAFNAFDQQLEFKLFDDAATFLIPIEDKKEDTGKEMETKQKIGKDMTAEEIGKVLLDAGVSPVACEKTVRILIRNGYVRVVPDAVVARINGKIDFMFGNHEFAGSFSLTENSEELDFVYFISTPSNTGRFVYSIENQKEANVDKNELPADAGERDGVTVSTFIKKRFKQQLESANLSEQSIEAILDRLFLGQGLKKPVAQSVLIYAKGPSVTNVYYSHDGSPVTLTGIEYSRKFEDGEVLSCSIGIDNAFFIIDTSDVKTFQEKMIHRHVGVPKLTLNLSNGKSIELPFKKEYIEVAEDAVVIHLNSNVMVSLSNKDLNSLTGWALTDLNEVEKSRFFVNGTEYTIEEFNRKQALWKKQGIIPNIE